MMRTTIITTTMTLTHLITKLTAFRNQGRDNDEAFHDNANNEENDDNDKDDDCQHFSFLFTRVLKMMRHHHRSFPQ